MIQAPFQDFGKNVFNDRVMIEKLPHPIYKKWKNASQYEGSLDKESADAIAHGMKEWAMSKGVTHFSHFFHPMHGTTAEKHVSFIDFGANDEPIARFNGKLLIKGEGDASSFPSGGLRATFEARGYTYWDITSPAFVIDKTLHIPTIFVSYNGETLDKKAPLIKSMQTLSKEATRLCNVLKEKDIKRVTPMIGLEQEYFLIDLELEKKRFDLHQTGRTLFGIVPPKSQYYNNHYYGMIPSRVRLFMEELNQELWKLGIYAKAEHNEVAPCQFEIAPIYCDANLAVDQNQITMLLLQSIAKKHSFACLLHEKPFYGSNGSGKHNNFSLLSDDGQNLFEPGEKPHENIRFLLFVCATLQAVDRYTPLLRMASSSVNNDDRLGGHEAPPAIISIYMGSFIEQILLDLRDGKVSEPSYSDSNIVISSLSYVPKDTSDRNRTSPFAFTGNKFEFRMLGSSCSAAPVNTVLNTIIADALQEISEELETLKYIQDIRDRALLICQRILKEHSRILFSGDGYHEEWLEEANKRGLVNIPKYVDSISSLLDPNVVSLFERHQIFSKTELQARSCNNYQQYAKQMELEARTLAYIIQQITLPNIIETITFYNQSLHPLVENELIIKKIQSLHQLYTQLTLEHELIESTLSTIYSFKIEKERAFYVNEHLLPLFHKARILLNQHENETPQKLYPFPTFNDLFYSL